MSAAILRYTKVPVPAIVKFSLTSYWLPSILIFVLALATYDQVNI